MRRPDAAWLIVIVASAAQPALAAERHAFAIPAGTLGTALIRFGEQSGLSIGALDPGVARARTGGVYGTLTPQTALGRLLAGSGYRFMMVDKMTIRIVPVPPPRHSAPAPPPPAALPAPEALQDIIVTASKRGTTLDDFGGGVSIVDLAGPPGAFAPSNGTEPALARLPMVSTTNLGPARNKLFIRGIADSSFTGPTQSTTGQYLGDVRLTYNAPDPDLNLYDIARIEVLQGPQGTLYGAGSLGGIIRLVPRLPDLHDIAASIDGGYSITRHGAPGTDIAGMANLPLFGGTAGLRVVGYRSIAGGYIDDAERGLSNVNRTDTAGGRAALRIEAGAGWTIDIGGARQDTESRDSQYAERGLPPLTRDSRIAQPFDNDYTLAQFSLRKSWGGLDFVSATGYVSHDVLARYDASGFVGTGPAALDEHDRITLISNETRLSRHYARGGWVIGASVISDVERINRRLGDPDDPPPAAGVRNGTLEAALFGEAAHTLGHGLTATLGGRITYTRLSGNPLDTTTREDFERVSDGARILPSAGLSWRSGPRFLWYLRYQEGYRPGGLALGDVTQQGVRRFRSDRIRTAEAGLRYGRQGVDRFTATIAFSGSLWRNIQADLVDALAEPFTANIGNGRILGLEASMRWAPIDGLVAEASVFANDGTLKEPAPGFATANESELPNIPDFGAHGALSYITPLSRAWRLRTGATLRYVGESRLGVGPVLDLPQGGYVETTLGATIETERFGFSLDITNVGDSRASRFALGNPFGVSAGQQITPLRPRTVRIGAHAAF